MGQKAPREVYSQSAVPLVDERETFSPSRSLDKGYPGSAES